MTPKVKRSCSEGRASDRTRIAISLISDDIPPVLFACSVAAQPRSGTQEWAIHTRETLLLAAEVAGVGTWDLSLLDDELHSSPRCREIFGIPAGAPFQYPEFLAALHPDDREAADAVVRRAVEPTGTGSYENHYRIICPDGDTRWIFAKGKVFFEERDGKTVATRLIGTVLDQTERRKAQEALIEAERFAVTGRLAATIAHEIRNPLESVTNLLYLLRGEPSEEIRTTYLAQAEEELARVAEIAKSTLRFYRDPVGTTAFDLCELIASVLVLFHSRIALLGIEVQEDLPRNVRVFAPQGELRQVFVNLIGNALDAMPHGGRLLFRVRVSRDWNAPQASAPRIRITVADTGEGMPPDVLAKIFQAFYTTKGEAGTGIGLWLTLEILRKCGSRIRVRSTAGRGSVFQFSLPQAAPSESAVALPGHREDPPQEPIARHG